MSTTDDKKKDKKTRTGRSLLSVAIELSSATVLSSLILLLVIAGGYYVGEYVFPTIDVEGLKLCAVDPGKIRDCVHNAIIPAFLAVASAILMVLIVVLGIWGLITGGRTDGGAFYDKLDETTDRHVEILFKNINKFSNEGFKNPAQIAAGEIFTEKAQIFLTRRANSYYSWGAFFVACAAFVLCLGVLTIATHDAPDFIRRISGANGDWVAAAVYFVRVIAIGGLFGGALYFFASLGRAYFHEGTVLLNRRHATRLGRLYMLIRFGERGQPPEGAAHSKPGNADRVRDIFGEKIEDGLSKQHLAALKEMPSWMLGQLDVSPKELEEAFGWNLSQDSAFKDMKPEKMTASLYLKLAEALGRGVGSATRNVTRGGRMKSGRSTDDD